MITLGAPTLDLIPFWAGRRHVPAGNPSSTWCQHLLLWCLHKSLISWQPPLPRSPLCLRRHWTLQHGSSRLTRAASELLAAARDGLWERSLLPCKFTAQAGVLQHGPELVHGSSAAVWPLLCDPPDPWLDASFSQAAMPELVSPSAPRVGWYICWCISGACLLDHCTGPAPAQHCSRAHGHPCDHCESSAMSGAPTER